MLFTPVLFFVSTFVSATRYILIPKDNFINNFEVHKISGEHNLEVFAEFKEHYYLPFYTTTKANLIKYRSTLSQFFDIEEDVTIKWLKSEKYKSKYLLFKMEINVQIFHLQTFTIVIDINIQMLWIRIYQPKLLEQNSKLLTYNASTKNS